MKSGQMQVVRPLKRKSTLDVEGIVIQVDNSEFEVIKRRGLIVWVYSLKQLKNLKKFGLPRYASRKMKYVVFYLNKETLEETEERIRKSHFIRNAGRSYRPDIEMNFAGKIGNKTVLKEEGFEIEELNIEIRLAEHL